MYIYLYSNKKNNKKKYVYATVLLCIEHITILNIAQISAKSRSDLYCTALAAVT